MTVVPVSASYQFLHPIERPACINEKIKELFCFLSSLTDSSWGHFNGSEHYNLCGINDHELAKALILKKIQENDQRKITILDIGAGCFQWAEGLKDYLDNRVDLPEGIEVLILAVRAEQFNPSKPKHSIRSKCTLNCIGGFNAEDAFQTFLDYSFDMIVSRRCFRLLVDPIGTWKVFYDLLTFQGLFLVDEFGGFDLLGKQIYLDTILESADIAFLKKEKKGNTHPLNEYIIQKQTTKSCSIPLSYVDIDPIKMGENGLVFRAMYHVAEERLSTELEKKQGKVEEKLPLIGNDSILYYWLLEKNLLLNNNS